ncbi:hypothetical protein JCM11251_006674 [Rhodosporidiobolus azoricus]
MKSSTSSSTGRLTPFSSPLGAMHHAPPSTQGESVRALFSFFRRNTSSPSSEKSSYSSSSTRALKKYAPSLALDCTIQTTNEKGTYSPLPTTGFSCLAPPPYSPSATSGIEEDLVVIDVDEEEEKMVLKLETKAERTERLKREKLERKRGELVEADKRMDGALRSMAL